MSRERSTNRSPTSWARRPSSSIHPAGDGLLRADYLSREDAVRAASNPLNGFRSLANPTPYGHPDHYSIRYTGSDDNGGVHRNSASRTMPSISRSRVAPIACRVWPSRASARPTGEQIENVFYRAFTQLLTPNATFSMARAATIQAARDLYGAGSAPNSP